MSKTRRFGGVLDMTVFALAGIAILIGLGIWQLDRKAWKEALIDRMTQRLTAAPVNLPPREEWDRLDHDDTEFRHVTFPAEFLKDREALVYTSGSALRPNTSGVGYWVLTPVRLVGGSVVVINRGFVPVDRKDPATREQGNVNGVIDLVGVIRWPDTRGLFTPADEPKNNVWYARDPKQIAADKGWGPVAPFYVEMEAPSPPGGLPRPGKLSANLRNTHLQYALTWFGLALGLAGVYVTWLAGRWRRSDP